MDALKKGLEALLGQQVPPSLIRLLIIVSQEGKVSYERIREEVDDPEEALLIALSYRILIPVGDRPTSEWRDLLLLAKEEEVYRMPRVVEYLIRGALQRGRWEVKGAIEGTFQEIGEEDWALMPKLIRRMAKESEGGKITAHQIREICKEIGLEGKVDPLIAELKATGVMSPRLGSLPEALKANAPIYELNPLLIGVD